MYIKKNTKEYIQENGNTTNAPHGGSIVHVTHFTRNKNKAQLVLLKVIGLQQKCTFLVPLEA